MDKIPTLYLRDPDNPSLVTREVNPEAAWLFEEGGVATVKKDGTNIRVHIAGGKLLGVEKRKNPSRKEREHAEREGRPKPEPTYVPARRDDPADKHIFAAIDATDFSDWPNGAWPCEALGPKIQGGVESDVPCLYPFSFAPATILVGNSKLPTHYDSLAACLAGLPIEGIVWLGKDGKMAKIKRRDFGHPWPA